MSSVMYRDAGGVRHEVIVRRAPTGDWQVLDICGPGTSVIETLRASEDGRPQAEAVARDYASNPGRSVAWAGPEFAEDIPERRGADADSDRRPRSAPRQPRAGGAALPHPAG